MTDADTGSGLGERLSIQFRRNVVVGYGLYVFRFAPLILLSIAVRILGDELVGIWVIISSLLGYANLLDLGIFNSVVKFVAEMHVKEDPSVLNNLVSTFLTVYSVLGAIVLIGTFLFVRFFHEFFRIPSAMIGQSNGALLIAGIGLAFSLPLSLFSGVLCGLHRYDLFHIAMAVSALAGSVLGIALLLMGIGIAGLAIANVASSLVLNAISIVAVHREAPNLHVSGRDFSPHMLRRVIGYSWHILVIAIAVQISYRSDALVIGLFMDKGSVTKYEIALRLNDLIRSIPSRLVSAVLPAASSLHASGNRQAVHRLLTRSTRYTLELIMPFWIVGFVLGVPLIRIWMGREYPTSAAVLTILLCATLASAAQSSAASVVQGIGRPGAISWVAVLDSLANLGLSIVLVRPLGLIGVALGTTIPIALSNLLLVIPIVCREIGLELRRFVRNALLLPTLLGMMGASSLFLLGTVLPPADLPNLVVVVLAFAVLYLAVWAGTRDKDECQFIERQFRLVLARFRA